MGIRLDIFSLYQLQSETEQCDHYLLLRVERPEFNNADEGSYAHADTVADQKKNALLETYKADVLAVECPGQHTVALIGELQGYPIGDVLSERPSGFYVDLWVADTKFGPPWVVMGTAESEAVFWHEIAEDDDLLSLGPSRPATQRRVYFLAEKEGPIGLGG